MICYSVLSLPSGLQALALCYFLDTNQLKVNLRGKEVLELGAGTGLVAIVASLLGKTQEQIFHNLNNLAKPVGINVFTCQA